MRIIRHIGVWLAFVLLLLLLPGLLVRGCNWSRPPVPDMDPQMINVFNHRTNELMEMRLGDYLLGVVVAEMPAAFELEALKAQAVVARTYTIKRLRSLGGSGCERHPKADICTDHTHCQAWLSQEEAFSRWSFFRQNQYWLKISQAVAETKGFVVVYQGKPIDAVFHSTCGGSTENSEDVWSNALPYLRARECRYCQHSPRLTETVRLSDTAVAARLGVNLQTLSLQVTRRTESGRIIEIDVGGGNTMRGLAFRSNLDLRSSRVTWLREQSVYTFTSTGYGHAIGMCQYGADGLAREGEDFQQIIKFYYKDVQVGRMVLEE